MSFLYFAFPIYTASDSDQSSIVCVYVCPKYGSRLAPDYFHIYVCIPVQPVVSIFQRSLCVQTITMNASTATSDNIVTRWQWLMCRSSAEPPNKKSKRFTPLTATSLICYMHFELSVFGASFGRPHICKCRFSATDCRRVRQRRLFWFE